MAAGCSRVESLNHHAWEPWRVVCAALTVTVPGLLCPLSGWQVLKPGAYAIDPLITRLHELKCVQGASFGVLLEFVAHVFSCAGRLRAFVHGDAWSWCRCLCWACTGVHGAAVCVLTSLIRRVPTAFLYGDHDWMDAGAGW